MQVIQDTLARVKAGTETTFRNLTMFPLLDGEELVGAKQNRVLNLTILAPARRTLIIPVSCVEAGRWAHQSAEFTSTARAHYAGGRVKRSSQVTESLRFTGQHRSDQSAVWADIEAKAERLAAHSPTQAMGAIYEKHAISIEEYVQAFSATDEQVGALFAINGEIIGFDLFDYAETLRKLLPKLVRSYGLDALDAQAGEPAAPSRSAAGELLLAVTQAEAQRFPAIGEGEDIRLTGANLTGAALVVDGRVVHLSVFRLGSAEQAETESFSASLSRPSARRRHQRER